MRTVKVTLDREEIELAIRAWLKDKGVVADKLSFSWWNDYQKCHVAISGGIIATTEGPHEKLMPSQGPFR